MALEHAPTQARVFVPVRRSLAPASLQIPMAYRHDDAWQSARAACVPGTVLVVHVSRGRVLAQHTEQGAWGFSTPVVMAQPTARGTPVRAAPLGLGERLALIWQRKPADGRGLIVEIAPNTKLD
jgi:hypothetical protein